MDMAEGDGMDRIIYIIIAFAAVIFSSIAAYFYKKRKVLKFIKEKYLDYNILSINWTLFGPWAPGKNNTKFKVILQEKDTHITKEIFAISSLFGNVFINE